MPFCHMVSENNGLVCSCLISTLVSNWSNLFYFMVEFRLFLGMMLSVPFLIATFLVYALLPELRNIHGKCLLCYLFSLTIGYSSLALLQLNGSNYIDPVLCRSAGFTAYFSFVCAFLWLNVISFDLWWNFR